MARKKAMVAPRPDSLPSIADILAMLGNNRAYTVIDQKYIGQGVWEFTVQLEGDPTARLLRFDGEKPEYL